MVMLEIKKATMVRAEALAIFVRFVRLNPQLAPDDPCMMRVLDAYEECTPARPAVSPEGEEQPHE